jgi:integrase
LSGVAFASPTARDEPVPLCTTRCVTATRGGSTTAKQRPDWSMLSAGRLRSKSRSRPQRGEILGRGELSLAEWAHSWLPTRLDLRPTTWARLETTMQKQVLPHFGSVPLNRITNAMVREWVSNLLSSGLSAATTRKAVFALRQCLAAAIADERIQINPASAVPLPTERQKPPRYLSQSEVERLVDQMPRQYRALVLVGAYAGLRWGEAAGLRRRDIDTLRPRIRVTSTAVQLRGQVTLDNEPKTTRSKRSVPVARSVMPA